MLSILRATAVAFVGLALMPALARAHIVADPSEGTAGAYFRTSFRVGHGCKGSPTVAVTIRLPESVIQARPMPKQGWTVEIRKRPLDPPVEGGHGTRITEAVSEIIWRGGRLEDAHFDEFGVTMRLPNRPDETLWFPVRQVCETGEHNWIGIPAAGQKWNDLEEPAPFVRVKKAGGVDAR